MTNDLSALEEWAGALLAKLAPGQRRVVGHQVAIALRRSQVKRIAGQRAPDGTTFIARKQRKKLRQKSGRIKRQKSAMFNKLRTAKYLKANVDDHQIAVGFFGKVARVARVHQLGLDDKVAPKGPKYHYPARLLLGFSESDRALIRDTILKHLVKD